MSPHPDLTPIRRLRKSNSLLVLSLTAGAIFYQTLTASAQSNAAKPAPDVIVFANGDQLTGTLERATGDSFVFKSDIVGEVTVSADKIKELRTGGKFVALKKDEKITRTSKQPGLVTFGNDALTMATTSTSAPEVIPIKDLAFLIDNATYAKEVTSNPGIWYGWHGAISGGITQIESTQTGANYNAAINLVRLIPSVDYLPPRTRSTINVLETYGKITQPAIPQTIPPTLASETKTSIFHADAEHDKYFDATRLYGLVGASFDHNFSQGLNLQQIYGIGLGWTLIKTPVQEFDVKADIHYERQNFQPPTASTNLVGSSFTEMYHRSLPAKMIFTESGTYIPAWNKLDAYSAIFAAGLQMPTYKRFSLNLGLLDNYLNNPAVGFNKNSFQFITGVLYTLK